MSQPSSIFVPLLAAAVLGAGIALGLSRLGDAAASAVRDTRAAQRVVTVKGLSEREVPADLAIWPLTFTLANDDLPTLQKTLDAHRATVTSFLTGQGFSASEISHAAPAITDLYAQPYNEAAGRPRYSAQTTITLRTTRVREVDKAVRSAGMLVEKGIVLTGGYGTGAQYFFTGLNGIKPPMIAEATQNARKAAEQFAKDSSSAVGAIRNAQQGLFSIEDRDQFTPELKKVRVVTTVDYFLLDSESSAQGDR